MHLYMSCVTYLQEMCIRSGSLSDQIVLQQNLETEMLNTIPCKHETLRKQNDQLTDIYSSCQKENSRSISIQTTGDQV